MGYSVNYTLAELKAMPGWERHFDLSGGAWAIPLVSEATDSGALLKHLVKEICKREGRFK
jgi:hypothetical protein